MPITGQLGTSSSLLGSVLLGSGPESGLDQDFSDSLNLNEDWAGGLLSNEMVDGLNFYETNPRPVVHWSRVFSDTLTYTETTVGYLSRNILDTFSLTEQLDVELSHGIVDTLDLNDEFDKLARLNRSMASVLEPYENLSVTTFLNKVFSDTLVLNETMEGDASIALQTDTIIYNEVMSGVQSKKLADMLVFNDIELVSKSLNAIFPDIIDYFDNIKVSLILHKQFGEELTFIETWIGRRNKFAISNDTLTFTDTLFRDIFAEFISSDLNYTEIWTVTKHAIGHASDSIIYSDIGARLATIHTTSSDILTYHDNYYIYKKGAGVTIRGAALTIVLPSPEFNDFEANQNKMIVGRSMTGDFRTYVKRTERERLNWKFIIPQPKKDELFDFVLNEINNTLIVDDFKGRRWSFRLLSDSFDFTEVGRWEPCGNKNEVTLEFEGQRYYG